MNAALDASQHAEKLEVCLAAGAAMQIYHKHYQILVAQGVRVFTIQNKGVHSHYQKENTNEAPSVAQNMELITPFAYELRFEPTPLPLRWSPTVDE